MGTNTMDTPNTTTPAVDPRDNIGMQWLVIGMVPGPLQFYCGTQTRREALDYIREDRPEPDGNEYYAVIKARDFFVEPGSGGAVDDDGNDEAEPIDEAAVLEWLAMRFRPSELEALRTECVAQAIDDEDAAKIALIEKAIERII